MAHYDPPYSPFEFVETVDGVSIVYDRDDKHAWRFADPDSEVLWYRRKAAGLRRAAADALEDARFYRTRLSGHGADWEAVYDKLTFSTRQALHCQRIARRDEAHADAVEARLVEVA